MCVMKLYWIFELKFDCSRLSLDCKPTTAIYKINIISNVGVILNAENAEAIAPAICPKFPCPVSRPMICSIGIKSNKLAPSEVAINTMSPITKATWWGVSSTRDLA